MKIDADPAVLQQVQGRFGHHIQGELDTLIAKWSELRDERREMLFFSTLGFKDSLSKQIRSHFDEQNIDPVAAVKQNPYILVEVDDIGFKLADAGLLPASISFSTGPKRATVTFACPAQHCFVRLRPYSPTAATGHSPPSWRRRCKKRCIEAS
jgi:hypothetical protein